MATKIDQQELRRKALVWTAIPIVVLCVVSTTGAAYEAFYWVWYMAAGAWLLAIAVTVVLYARGARESATGVLYGIGIGILPLFTTGLINFAIIQSGFQ